MVMRTSGVKIVRAMQTLARALAMVRTAVRSSTHVVQAWAIMDASITHASVERECCTVTYRRGPKLHGTGSR